MIKINLSILIGYLGSIQNWHCQRQQNSLVKPKTDVVATSSKWSVYHFQQTFFFSIKGAFGTVILHTKNVILIKIVENVLLRIAFLKKCDLKTKKNLHFQIASKG